jgi:hypothetical protein
MSSFEKNEDNSESNTNENKDFEEKNDNENNVRKTNFFI